MFFEKIYKNEQTLIRESLAGMHIGERGNTIKKILGFTYYDNTWDTTCIDATNKKGVGGFNK